jgi:hypothetical protein
MSRWLKLLGTGEDAMDESAVPLVLRDIGFPRRPSLKVGDKVVLYAIGHDCVFAIVEVFSPVRAGTGPHPWDSWRCEVRPVCWTTYSNAPGLASLTAPGGRDLFVSIRQQSHLKLTDGEYLRAVRGLEAAGAEMDGFYRP